MVISLPDAIISATLAVTPSMLLDMVILYLGGITSGWTKPYHMVILCISLDIPPILVNTMSKNIIQEMEEIEAIEAKHDMSTREGVRACHKEMSVRNDLKKIDKYQSVFEHEHQISKEDWENTTFSVKMAMIYMHEEQYTVADIEDQLREWLDTCPI